MCIEQYQTTELRLIFFLIITQNGVIKKCSESSQKEVKSLKNRKKLPFIAR